MGPLFFFSSHRHTHFLLQALKVDPPLQQKVGDVVTAPPCWVHFVVNAQECTKLAFDRIQMRDLVKMAVANRRAARLFGYKNAQDYFCGADKVIREFAKSV